MNFPKLEPQYVVVATVDGTDEFRIVHYDPDCGYCMTQSSARGISGYALMDRETAEKVMTQMLTEKPRTFGDGTVYPGTDISSGLGLSNSRARATGALSIRPVLLGAAVRSENISGEIKRPTGYTYD